MHPNALHLPILFDLLGVFSAAASGALTAIRKGLDLFGIAVLGAVTAVGGGVIRDMLVAEVPTVLRRDFYAVPALIGALIIAVSAWLEPAATPLAFVAAGTAAALRMIGVRRSWHARLPQSRRPEQASQDTDS